MKKHNLQDSEDSFIKDIQFAIAKKLSNAVFEATYKALNK